MENKLGRSIIVVFLCLLITIFGVVPEVYLSILAAAHQDLLLCRMPLKYSDLLFVEAHRIEMVRWHAYVPHRDGTVLARASKHILVDIIKRSTVESLLRDLACKHAALCAILSQVPSTLTQSLSTTFIEEVLTSYRSRHYR